MKAPGQIERYDLEANARMGLETWIQVTGYRKRVASMVP